MEAREVLKKYRPGIDFKIQSVVTKSSLFFALLCLFLTPNQKLFAVESTNEGNVTRLGAFADQQEEYQLIAQSSPPTLPAPQQVSPPPVKGEFSDNEIEKISDLCEFAKNPDQCKQKITEIRIERFEAVTKYDIWQLSHRKLVFRMSSIFHSLIFLLVIGIVGIGLYLSYLKFQEKDTPETKLKLAKGNIEINSNVIGVVILAFSLVFFYLYVIHVYPVRVVDFSSGDTDSASSNNQN